MTTAANGLASGLIADTWPAARTAPTGGRTAMSGGVRLPATAVHRQVLSPALEPEMPALLAEAVGARTGQNRVGGWPDSTLRARHVEGFGENLEHWRC